MPSISIIICSRNRADSLRETLASIGQCEVPPDLSAELLVVDNGSSDHTAAVVAWASANLKNMPVRYALEPVAGVSRAKNRALAESRGDILLWTDDDVRVPVDWIEGMCRPIVENRCDATAGHIRVAPALRRRWLIEGFPALAASTETCGAGGLSILIGANMAFSRRVLAKVPGFDSELGPGALGFFEDTLFSWQLSAAGFRLLAVEGAPVEHHFSPERLKPRNVLKTVRAMYRSEAYVFYHWQHGSLRGRRWWPVVRKTLALCARRVWRSREWACEDAPAYWVLPLVAEYAFLRQYFRERQRPRYYEKFGLLKHLLRFWNEPLATREQQETPDLCGAAVKD